MSPLDSSPQTKVSSSLDRDFLITGLSPTCGIWCLADIPTSKKFLSATLTNSLRSRPHFILNWGVKVAMFLFYPSLSNVPFILHARHKHAGFVIQGKLSSLLQSSNLLILRLQFSNLTITPQGLPPRKNQNERGRKKTYSLQSYISFS